ncbi:hypothetical protein RB594_000208 [Gaeumannomyces avenae]
MPPFNHYQHQALCAEDAIRLILLDATADIEAPLSCSLIQRPRSARHVEYFAISYAWGVPELTHTLEIKHDDDDTSYLRITSNVDDLLRHFRSADDSYYLWIDAICLNQDDAIEKARQIPMMGRIFEEAEGVQIWVGPSVPETANLFAFFHKSSGIPKAAPPRTVARLASAIQQCFGELGAGVIAIYTFFRRPWFSRRWVIQEACLARQAMFHCGTYSIPLPTITLAAKYFQSFDRTYYSIGMAARLRRPSVSRKMMDLLWNFHEAACLEPRDRIAALFGLVGEESRFPLDWAAHWTDLYKEVASYAMRNGGNEVRLELLQHLFEFGPLVAPPAGSYPSWVPDWTKIRRSYLPYHSLRRGVDVSDPSSSFLGHPALVTLEFTHETLQIYGDALTSRPHDCNVTFASSILQPSQDQDQCAEGVIAVLRELFTAIPDAVAHLPTLSSLVKAVARFCYRGVEERTPTLGTALFDDFLENISQTLPERPSLETVNPLKDLPRVMTDGSLLVLGQLHLGSGSCRGYGLGPEGTQLGDMVVPLWHPDWDSDAPFPRPDGFPTDINAMYTLVVRLTGESCFQHESGSPDEALRQGVLKARVVGPALCIFPEALPSDKGVSDILSASDLNMGQRCFACLVQCC